MTSSDLATPPPTRPAKTGGARRVLIASLAAVLVAGSIGCGLLEQAQNLVGAASVLSEFSDRLGKAATLTYTAEYRTTAGDTFKLVQQPPNAAYIGTSGSFIFTEDFLYLCHEESGVVTCQKSPNDSDEVSTADSGYIAGGAGSAFVTPEIALALILAAALVPGATVSKSEKTIAGQHSLCATASGLESAASPGDTDAPKDFSVCVTDAGVLSSFSGTSTNGVQVSIEMTSFALTADPSAFSPPAGANVVDVNQLQTTGQ